MDRPIIGISGYREQARWDIWDCEATLIQQSYVRALAGHGGRAVVLPPDEVDAGVMSRLDGLVLASGADVDPSQYGASPHPTTDSARRDRDAGEMLLLRAALELGLPVLGVCRGMQLLAVVAGGSLHQHLPETLGHSGHCPAEGVLGNHEVSFTLGSLAARLFGERAVVNSHHHQGVADPGRMHITGRSADGLAEALEDPTQRFVLGVQWHPELVGGDQAFGAFVAACAAPVLSTGGRVT